MAYIFPRTQNELIRQARGDLTQREFAEHLDVDKSCLSRYESGKLGAPVAVIDHCLSVLADRLHTGAIENGQATRALTLTKQVVGLLEAMSNKTSR